MKHRTLLLAAGLLVAALAFTAGRAFSQEKGEPGKGEGKRMEEVLGPSGEPLPKGMRLGPKAALPDGKEVQVYLWKLPGEAGEIEMVYVPPGDFIMGSDDGNDDEKPRHRHPMPAGYFIGRYDTTWKEYRAFCRATGRTEPQAPDWRAKDDHPVVNVSWDDAKAFCDWAGLRLPSEAEWENAARGTDGRKYPWGEEDPTPDRCVWDGHPTYGNKSTAPVGSCPRGASPYGALDMAGNVWQWCEDWYDEKAYARYASGQLAPPGGGSYRVYRGGSWGHVAWLVRAADRDRVVPSLRWVLLGFRPLRSYP